jgi:RNA-binding protein YlmH
MLPRQELMEGSRHREALEAILDTAEQALRSWTPCWSGFIDGAVREDAEGRLAALAELTVQSEGGHPGAERRRLLLQRPEAPIHPSELPDELLGLEISGNFLFDPSTALDFRQGLLLSLIHI